MARRIFKYEILPGVSVDSPRVEMPHGAEILSVGAQDAKLVLWAMVDTEAPIWPYRLSVYPTGATLPGSPGRYLGTAQMHVEGMELVWHVFLEQIG